jgi:outer membrane protein insertion porin family
LPDLDRAISYAGFLLLILGCLMPTESDGLGQNVKPDVVVGGTDSPRPPGTAAIAAFDFAGNRAFSSDRLRIVIETRKNQACDAAGMAADVDLLRRFYLRKGYFQVRVAAAIVRPCPAGPAVTFTIDEGDLYRFGTVDMQSSIADVDPASLHAQLPASPGGVYNPDSIDRAVETIALEAAKGGHPFTDVRPRIDADVVAHVVNVVFLLDEGPHAYVERIIILGSRQIRDYVIRREFDAQEGDAYNKTLIARAARRLRNLAVFKQVNVTERPGPAPDRIVVDVDVEEWPKGESPFGGGYRGYQ